MFKAITSLPPFAWMSDDPAALAAQSAVLLIALVLLFLLLFTLRDILLRTHSFLYQALCLLIVALLPGIGFLFYLLIRPARTIKEREVERMLREVMGNDEGTEAAEEIDPTSLEELHGAREDKDDNDERTSSATL